MWLPKICSDEVCPDPESNVSQFRPEHIRNSVLESLQEILASVKPVPQSNQLSIWRIHRDSQIRRAGKNWRAVLSITSAASQNSDEYHHQIWQI